MIFLNGPPGYGPGTRVRKVLPEGNGGLGVLLVGEAAGEHEAADGLPFRPHAEAGSVLQNAFRLMGLSRENLLISNVVWYHPPRNWLEGAPWELEAKQYCRPFNDELIERYKPKVILAMGGTAFREMTGIAGAKRGIEMCRGFVLRSQTQRLKQVHSGFVRYETEVVPWASLPVVGTYHPSFLRRGAKERERNPEGAQGRTVAAGGGTQGMNLLGVLIRDLQLCLEIAQKGAPVFSYDDYKLGGTLDEWRAALAHLRDHPELPVVYDLETLDSLIRESEEDAEHTQRDVTQVQISWRIGQALTSVWSPDLLPIFREIIQLPNMKIDWNGRKFDRPILRDMAIRTDIGDWLDLMDGWHHAQPDLPRGLQFATSFFCPEVGPWKHLAETEALLYGCYDVDMPQRIFTGLRKTMSMIRDPHSGISLWGDGKYAGFTGQVMRLSPVLDGMTLRGIPVDEDKRCKLDEQFSRTLGRKEYQEYLSEHGLPALSAEELGRIEGVADRMQALVPDEIRSVDPAKGYKQTPKALTQLCKSCGGKKVVANPEWKPRPRKGRKAKAAVVAENVEWPETVWEVIKDHDQPVAVAAVLIDETAKTAETAGTAEVPKTIPCAACEGEGRIALETIPAEWVRRTFRDEEKCDCVRAANAAIARAKREAKKAHKLVEDAGKVVGNSSPAGTADADFGRVPSVTAALDCPRCHGTGKFTIREERWSRLSDFLPGSWQQVLRYLKYKVEQETGELTRKFLAMSKPPKDLDLTGYVTRHQKWVVPLDYKTGAETTAEAELRRLAIKTEDQLLPMVLEFREIAKLRGTYVQGWKPSGIEEFLDPETGLTRRIGRVHPTFGFRPATGQLSSEDPNCFSADTEILTESGWVLFPDLPRDVNVAQFDEETEDIDFAKPLAYIDQQFTGDLHHIHTELHIDLLVTQGHQCLLRHRKTGEWRRFSACCYPTGWCQYNAGNFVGGTESYRPSQLILIAALQADGSQVVRKYTKHIEFGFSKERKIERLREALEEEGIEFTENYHYGRNGYVGQTRFHIGHPPDWLWGWKFFDSRILQMDQESFSFLAEEVWRWDGYAIGRTMYASAAKSNSDWVHILTVLSGRRGRMRIYQGPVQLSYQIDAADRPYCLTANLSNELVKYDGRVYCVTMPKGTVIVRRNHRVAITGNSQNFPSHSELAHAMQQMISSRPRYKMVKLDFKSFHAITAGFEAQDLDWTRIARVDIHSFFVLVGLLKLERPEVALSWSSADLKDRLKWWRGQEKQYTAYARQKHPGGMTFAEIRDEIAKRVVYGWEFGQGARSLFMLWPESFASTTETERFQAELRGLFGKIDKWQTAVRLEADRLHYLTSRFGFIRRFWEVFYHRRVLENYEAKRGEMVYLDRKGDRWIRRPGSDHEAVVAFRPANTAFGMKRQALVKLREQGLDEKYGLISETHDDFRFECPVGLVDEMLPVVRGIMEERSPYLIDPVVAPDGLWCGTDVGVGNDWDSLEKIA